MTGICFLFVLQTICITESQDSVYNWNKPQYCLHADSCINTAPDQKISNINTLGYLSNTIFDKLVIICAEKTTPKQRISD